MIQYAKERLCDAIAEMQPMLELHYDELTLHKEVVKLDPDWQRYADLEHAGKFHLFTARQDGALIGYSAFFLQPHLHYRSLMLAMNDVLFLHPQHRNGMTGIRLIKTSEHGMKVLGANKIVWHAKYSNDLATILARLGYELEEVMVGKIL